MEPVPFYSDTQSECSKARHKLIGQDSNPLFVCFACKVGHLKDRPKIVYCEICNSCYHDEDCRYFKPEIRHPFHLSHPLTLVKGHYSRLNDTVSEGSYRKCNCCRGPLLSVGNYYYHCSICNYRVKEYCCRTGPLMLSIAHPKSHEHTLTIFPGRFTFPCNACGESLDDIDNYVYTCLPCNYMVHGKCIYLPRVIKITRHQHRLSHSSFLPLGDFSCGVCHQTVDIDYGQYSCNNGCPYVVHSRCATRDDVWDGIDLEGVPEEPKEDMEPFVRIDEETIQHFSHEHYLRLHQNYIPSGNRYMFCQVCALPVITSASFYSCMQCDFVLDEACACLPRKTHHLLHKHPLTLLPICPPWSYETLGGNFDHKGAFRCHGCRRHGCGFVYICRDCDFKLDTRCASLPDPLIHDCHLHDHPLFFHVPQIISFAWLRPHDKPCKACKRGCGREYVLECIKCKFYLCITCATIPRVANYRYDKHPLTLCYGEEDAANLQYWCEICESKLDASKWFYTCDYCRVTLHRKCLLGEDPYMKPNYIFTKYGMEIEAALNGNPRPFCDYCAHRCSQHLVFKSQDITFCSLRCSIE